jgi:hypothetical protein
MKSCRCLETNPSELKEECLLPWAHEESRHISGSSIWKSNAKTKHKEKQAI